MRRSFVRLWALLCLAAAAGTAWGEEKETGLLGSLGLGYLHTAGEIDQVWTDGGEAEVALTYRPVAWAGVELAGILGGTGIGAGVKTTVGVVDSYGSTGEQTSDGGVYWGVLLGPQLTVAVANLEDGPVRLRCGGGALYYGEEESGIDAEGYTRRWTSGWGWFASVGAWFPTASHELKWGLQLRFLNAQADVGDFLWPRQSATDQRWILSADILLGE